MLLAGLGVSMHLTATTSQPNEYLEIAKVGRIFSSRDTPRGVRRRGLPWSPQSSLSSSPPNFPFLAAPFLLSLSYRGPLRPLSFHFADDRSRSGLPDPGGAGLAERAVAIRPFAPPRPPHRPQPSVTFGLPAAIPGHPIFIRMPVSLRKLAGLLCSP